MSRFRKNVGRRILAYLLSGAMIMSNMTTFASEPSKNTGDGYYEEALDETESAVVEERTDEAAEVEETSKSADNKSNGQDDEIGSSDETEEETEIETSDDEQASVMRSSLREEEEETESTEKSETKTETNRDTDDSYRTGTITWYFDGTGADYSFQKSVQGSTAEFYGLQIDATCENGKLAYNSAGYAQFNSGTIIKVPVSSNAEVTVEAYPGQYKYTVGGEAANANNFTYSHTGEAGYVDVVATGGAYIYWIKVVNIVNTDIENAPTISTDNSISKNFYNDIKEGTISGNLTSDIDGITFTNFECSPTSNNHGAIGSNGTIKLNLASGRRANISVITCRYDKSTVKLTGTGTLINTSVTNDGETAPQYTVLGAEGNVTLTFSGQSYLHLLTVNYLAEDEYLVTVSDDGNGTATADKNVAKNGDTVTLTPKPNNGYGFKEWEVVSGGVTVNGNNAFTMPSNDVEVKAIFEATGPRKEWDFTKSDTTLHTNFHYEGSSAPTGEVAGLLIDAANGKFQDNTSNVMVNPNTSIKVPVTDVENEEGVKVTVQWYSGNTKYTVAGNELTSEAHTEQTVTCQGTVGDDGKKYVEIILTGGQNYLEKIMIAPADEVIAEGAEINFSTEGKNHAAGAAVEAEKGFTFSGFTWHSPSDKHGITGRGTIGLNLAEGKRAKITVIGCAYGGSPTLTFDSGTLIETSVTNDGETAPQYTILGAEGSDFTISFSGSTYIHYIKVEYLADEDHLLFVSADGNGTASASVTTDGNTVSGSTIVVKENETVTLTAEPENSNYGLTDWIVTDSEDFEELNITTDINDENVATFTMPAGDVEITAVFELTGTPTKWDFTDGTLTGDNGMEFEGISGEVQGLQINATSGKWDSKSFTDKVQVNNGTTITVPFDGVDADDCDDSKYVVTVLSSTATYRVGNKAATLAGEPEKFICDGTEAVITVTANSTYISYIKVEPLQYVEAGTINFATSNKEVINTTKGLTATNIEWHDTSHGVYTGKENGVSTIELSLSDKANITVLSCRYNCGGDGMKGTMTASSGEVTVKGVDESGADGPQFTVLGAEAGDLLLTFGDDMYIHNIIVEYPKVIVPGSRNIDVWDFAGKLESDTDTYTNNITADALINAGIIKDGLFSDTGSAKFGDLTMNFNGSDRFYSTVEDAKSIAQSDNSSSFVTVEYEDGFESAGGFYCNGTGGSARRNIMIDNVQAGDKIIAYIGLSQNGPSQFFFEGMGAASEQKDSVDALAGPAFQKYEFVAEYTGTYKIWENAIGKPMYHRIVRVPGVAVSGAIDFGSYTGTDYSVKFVNNTNKKETVATVDGTNYTVTLAPGFTYTAVLSGATGYGFTAATKTVEVRDSEYKDGKTGVNLVVEPKAVYTYSGKVVGFEEGYNTKDLTITMMPSKDSESDEVVLTIDENLNFTAALEQGVQYTIEIAGVDDYEVKSERTITKSEDYLADITVGLKYMYPVSGGFIGLGDSAQVTALKFTILDEKGNPNNKYVYNAELVENGYSINLRNGDYLASATVEGYSTQTHVVVNGASVEKDLLFVATSATKESIAWTSDIYVGYSGRENNYETINDAMDACERMTPAPTDEAHRITVHIAPGTYREQITVNTPYVSFVNDTPSKTVLVTWYYGIGYKYYSADASGYYNPQNAFDKYDKHIAAKWGVTVYVKSTAKAFRAEGITFENSFNRYITDEEIADGVEVDTCRFERTYGADVESRAAIERAAAMVIEADQTEFKDCGFYSSQDTLYTAESSVHGYFKNCVIEGNTDYMYGGGDYVFDGCELSWKGYSDATTQGGYITATRPASGNLGYLFRNCVVTGNEGYTVNPGYFGRTWGADAKVVLLNTKLQNEDMIAAKGWYPMNGDPKDANYFEYNTTTIDGNAVDVSERVRGVIGAEEAAAYTAESFFGDWTPAYYQAEAEGEVTFTTEPVLVSSGDLSAPHPGHTLTVQYSMGAADDANDASIIQWYRVDGSTETLIKTTNASDKSFQLTGADVGKQIKVTVMPATSSGRKGDAASCTLETAVLEGYDETVEFATVPSITSNSNINVPHVGDILTAKYSLDSANQAKDASVIKWYRVKDDAETLIIEKTAPEKTYELTAADVGFFIKIEVTPVNVNGSKGEAKTYTMQNVVTERNTAPINPDPEKVSAPVASPEQGTVGKGTLVSLTSDTEDALIYYTLDGTVPGSRSSLYSEAISLGDEEGTVTIKAIAIKEGYIDSDVATFVYTISGSAPEQVSAPVANPAPGTVEKGTSVKLTSATEGANIYYTLDGSNPTTESSLYTGPIVIEKTVTIKAVAEKEGWLSSAVVSFEYVISDGGSGEPNDPNDPNDPDNLYGEVEPDDIPSSGKIPEGLWNATVNSDNCYYTGKAVKPEVHVYDGKKRLIEGTDYTLAYKNNVKAYELGDDVDASKQPFVTVKGKGNYSGSDTIVFEIHRVSLTDGDQIGANAMAVAVATGSVKKTAPVITFNGKKLAIGEGKDITVTYPEDSAYQTEGTYSIKVTAVPGGNFKDSIDVTLRVLSKDAYKNSLASSFKVDKIPTQMRTGDRVTPEPTVKDKNGNELTKDTNYTLSYRNNIEAGTATLVITGIGDYAGAKEIKFKISTTPLKNATFSGFDTAQDYKGTAVKLSSADYSVTYEGATLLEGTDYTVTYKNNNKAGKASAIITGIGNYSGSVTKPFVINAFNLETEDKMNGNIGGDFKRADANNYVSLSVPYEKGGSNPAVILTVYGHTMTEGTDFTVSYKNNASAFPKEGKEPTITIKGKGGLTGTLTRTFTIEQQDLSEVVMAAPDVALSGTAGKYASKVTLTDINGKKLSAGSDYGKTVTYELVDENGDVDRKLSELGETTVDLGTAQLRYIKATVSAPKDESGSYTGNYKGEASVIYRVGLAANDLKKAKITINYGVDADGKAKKYFDYTGSGITLGRDDLTVEIGSAKLAFDTNFKLPVGTYVNNVKKGTASVTVSGVGTYIGTKVVKFKIGTKNLAWIPFTDDSGDETDPGEDPGTGDETDPGEDPGTGDETDPGEDPGTGDEEPEPGTDSEEAVHTIWLVGDSTVCSFTDSYYYPRYGYGTQIRNYETGYYTVNNLAASGRSSLSFLTDSADNYKTLKDNIAEGDVLIIGFGHNDEKDDEEERFTDPTGDYRTEGSFAKSLYDNYVQIALNAGAQPILCTPIVRRNSSDKLSDSNCHITSKGDYAEAIRKLGTDVNVPVVDLTALTKELYENIGSSETLYLHSWKTAKDSTVDNTHLNIYGAKVVAHMLAKELSKLTDLEISKHITNIKNAPTKEADLVVNPDYKEIEYTAPTEGSEIWKDYGIFKGSTFGNLGGTPNANNYVFTKDEKGNMRIQVLNEKGKITDDEDGIAMYYYRLPKDSTFTLTATATVISIGTNNPKQIAFGLMARDDMYIDNNVSVNTDYVAAGTFGSGAVNCFYRKDATLNKGPGISDVVVGNSYDLKIAFNGEGYACTFGDNATQSGGYDFTLDSVDTDYQYIGMFVARTANITFSNIKLTVDGEEIDLMVSDDEDTKTDHSIDGDGGVVEIPAVSNDEVVFSTNAIYGYKSVATFEVLNNMKYKTTGFTTDDGTEYAGYVQGDGNGSDKAYVPPSGVAAYKITAVEDSTITFVTKHNEKTLYFVNEADTSDSKSVTTSDGGGGSHTYPMEAGKTYYFYAGGSKVMVGAISIAKAAANEE